jgi:hypothetical protein
MECGVSTVEVVQIIMLISNVIKMFLLFLKLCVKIRKSAMLQIIMILFGVKKMHWNMKQNKMNFQIAIK